MQNDDICKTILEHLLKVRLDHIERQEVQKELKPYYESRGVRFDAYVKDSSRIFNVEMQKVLNQEAKDFILKDETSKIFFNASAAEYEKDLEIQSFLNYIKCKEPTDELTDKIAWLVEEIKNREQNKEAYMIEHLKIRDSIMEGRREGRIEGAQQKTIEAAKNFYANGASYELISKSLGMTIDQVKEIVKDVVRVTAEA